MPDFLIRGLDDRTMERLKERAAKHGRSLQSEIKDTLRRSLKMTKEESLEASRRLRERTRGMDLGDSAAMIREDRER
jgi:plasmid stability protein